MLTAKEGSLIIIDEPERHLHRSIVSPLLRSLFEKREDCGFVVSTHDVSLPVDSPESSILLLRSCSWQGNTAIGWDADLLEADAAVLADLAAARQAMVDEVRPHRDRLCARFVERRARAAVRRDLPTHESLLQNPVHNSVFDATGLIAEEQTRFDALVTA